MPDPIQNYRTIDQIKEELSQYGFTNLETIKLAIQIQRNEILAAGLYVVEQEELGFLDR